MTNKNYRIPCAILRGGTSKGLFILEKDLPSNGEERDDVLLQLMGSPDTKQIDGLGGATSVTSKVAIIGVSSRDDADVDYTFAQVSVDKNLVSYKGNCGNISSAVGPFSMERGLVKLTDDLTTVRIHNVNTGKIIKAEVETENGAVKYHGDFKIAGVPGTAAPIKLKFVDPAGTIGDSLLPTGSACDMLDIPDFGEVKVSIVDAANPLVFVKAADVGLTGTELPADLDSRPEMLELLEKIRGMAAVKLGLIDDYTKSPWETPGIPKMTFVTPPAEYINNSGNQIAEGEIDLLSRMMSMQKTHPTYAMTGAMCTAAAAIVPDSVVAEVLRPDTDTQFIRIGHPGGVLEAGVDYDIWNDEVVVEDTFGFRTANLLMDGTAFC